MAKVQFSLPLKSFSGSLGNMVYVRQSDGEVYVRSKPEVSRKRTVAQRRQQERLRAAAAYWRMVKNDPVKLEVYRAIPKQPRLGPQQLAMRDYFSPPVLGEIDLSGYDGRAGQWLSVSVVDDTVAQVTFEIVDLQGELLEGGAAAREQNAWKYQTNTDLPAGETVTIHATAKDLPGNTSSKTCFTVTRANVGGKGTVRH